MWWADWVCHYLSVLAASVLGNATTRSTVGGIKSSHTCTMESKSTGAPSPPFQGWWRGAAAKFLFWCRSIISKLFLPNFEIEGEGSGNLFLPGLCGNFKFSLRMVRSQSVIKNVFPRKNQLLQKYVDARMHLRAFCHTHTYKSIRRTEIQGGTLVHPPSS